MDNKIIKFNILPGFVPNDSLSNLKKYNIKEVYVGFFDEYSEKRWPVCFYTINRRGEGANFFGVSEFKKLAKQAKENNIGLFVAFNIHYMEKQLDWVVKSIIKISKYSVVKGIIVSDIGLLLKLKKLKYKKKIIISTLSTIFNKYAIDFFTNFGAKRFVLDRQFTAKEILDIVKSFPQYQYEIFFLMGDGCLFIDGYCSSMHVQETGINKRYNTSVQETLCMKVINKQSLTNKLMSYKCNICLLYYLKDLNNVTLKIPNRTITNSTCSNIINSILEIEEILSKPNIKFNNFNKFCKKIFKRDKGVSCNPKVCLCRDLFI